MSTRAFPIPSMVAIAMLSMALLPPPAVADWPTDPALNLPIAVASRRQMIPHVTPDGAGGAFLMWSDNRDSAATGSDAYAQHVDASGTPLWAANGVVVSNLLQDEAPGPQDAQVLVPATDGGVFLAYTLVGVFQTGIPTRARLQRLDANGIRLWGPAGIDVTTLPGSMINPRIISDDAGGVIVAWSGVSDTTQAVWAQRFNASGEAQWAANGVVVCASDIPQAQELIPDGQGGALIAWMDWRSPESTADLYAQRVSASGIPQWTANGVPVCTTIGENERLKVASDGAGGLLMAWIDARSGTSQAYAQRITSTGAPAWTVDGLAFCPDCGPEAGHWITSGTNGEAIVGWGVINAQVLRAQRFGTNGERLWGPQGLPVCQIGNPALGLLAADGFGGAYVVWADARFGARDLFAQRLMADGTARWVTNGVLVSSASSITPFFLSMGVDPSKGIVVGWSDNRADQSDIYAQQVDPTGSLGGTVGVSPQSVTTPLALAVPGLCRSMATIRYHLPREGRTRLTIFDTQGRTVARLVSEFMIAGDHVATWNFDDGAGVYFAQLTWEGESRAARFVALR